MRGSILILILACLLAPKALAHPQLPPIEVGQSRSGWVEPGDPRLIQGSPTQRLQLVSKSQGKVTISVNSFDFDAYLRVEAEAGDILAEADGGGIETNARLVVELDRDRTYHVLVAARGGGSGWFWVDCQRGEPPPISREAIQIAAVAYHGGAANTELAKGEIASAASHLERKGFYLVEQGKFDEAKGVFESARSLWEDSKDEKRRIHATLELGRIGAALKDWKGAEECFSQTLTAYRALHDAGGEAETLLAMAAARAAAADPAAASSLFGEALAVAEKHADAKHAALALAGIAELGRAPADREKKGEIAGKLGDMWRAGGDLEKARENHRRAVEVARENKDPVAEASALSDLGEDWLRAGELAHARECFEKAFQIARDTGHQAAQAEALESLGVIWFKLQDYRRALRLHEQQLEVAGSDEARAGRATLLIGMCYLALRDYPAARTRLESEAKRAGLAGDRAAEADALQYLSFVELRTGNVEAGLKYRGRAAELRQGSEQEGPWYELGKGVELLEKGEFVQAQDVFEKSLEQARSSGNLRLRIETSLRLGQCYQNRGRYADAIRCFADMVDIARTLHLRLDEGEGLECLGGQYLAIGALDSALGNYEEALSIAREFGDPIAEMEALNGVGGAWLELQQFEKAREFHQQVGILGRKLGWPIVEAHSQNNVGLAYWKAGRYEESRPYLEKAVQIAAKQQARILCGEFQGNLARVLLRLGESERAHELATESLTVLGAADAPEPRKSLIAFEALVPLAIGKADFTGARALLDRADIVLEEVRVEAQAAPGEVGVDPWINFPPFDRFRQDLVRQVDQSGNLAPAERADLRDQGFRDADRARARRLASGIVGHRRGTRSKDTLTLRGEWKQALTLLSDKQKEASRAIRDGRPAEEVDRLQQDVLAQRTKAANLGDALREVSPGDAALDLPEGVDPSVVRGTGVTKECALIEYAEGDEDLYAYVLTETGLTLLHLGKRKAVEEVVERYLGMIGAQDGPSSPNAIAEVGRQLFDLVLAAPLAAAGQGTARLLIVPTPSLAVLPFDSLVVSTQPEVEGFGDLEFVIDRFEVNYCPSASILVLLSSSGPRKLSGKVLVLADPTYPSEDLASATPAAAATKPSFLAGTRASPNGQDFQRLMKTREEAITIAGLFLGETEVDAQARLTRLQKERGGSLRAKQIDLCLGADASAARLAGDLRPYTALHLAAHGWVDGETPEKSGIALAWSGSGAYDGFFTLADAVGLDLDADLVVLSACETARGRVRVGEGVESMACAFLNAGARGVVASLWQVDDWAAAETMKSVYEGILTGKRPAEALHAAKLAIRRGSISRGLAQKPGDVGRRDKGNPCDWAPFIHIGLPR